MSTKQKVIILGAGVAGIRVAKDLPKLIKKSGIDIVLIDHNDYHQYLYRIHEVCNLEYKQKKITVSITRLIDNNRVLFKKNIVKDIDNNRKIVVTETGDESYDILIIALGSHPAYFNIEGIRENSLTLGSYQEAQVIRDRINTLLKKSEIIGKAPQIIIGGAGFTGVELAGELTDSLPIWYQEHKIQRPKKLITVVEALSTILPGWNKELTQRGQEVLEHRGVEFFFNDPIVKVSQGKLELKSGKVLETDLFIWTGGVACDPACGLNFELKNRRISVDEFCRAKGYEDIFVAGDMACTVNQENIPQPPTAHIATVQGNLVAHNVSAKLRGGSMDRYVFDKVGEIVTLGRTDAIGDLFGFHFTGVLAKFLKKVVHWWYLHSIGGFSLLFQN